MHEDGVAKELLFGILAGYWIIGLLNIFILLPRFKVDISHSANENAEKAKEITDESKPIDSIVNPSVNTKLGLQTVSESVDNKDNERTESDRLKNLNCVDVSHDPTDIEPIEPTTTVESDDTEAMMNDERSLKECILSPLFVLMLFWYCTLTLRDVITLGIFVPWVEDIFDGDEDKGAIT